MNDSVLLALKLPSAKERQVITNVGILYDILADAVDEINSIFSKQVNKFFA